MTDTMIAAYLEEYIDRYESVLERVFKRNPAGSEESQCALARQIAKDIIGPFVYWLERNDAKFMEGKDPDFVPASQSTAAGKPESSPPRDTPPQAPSSSSKTVFVTVKGKKTYTIKEDLKTKWNLKWNPDNMAWEGNIPKTEVINLMRFCDETGGIEVYGG